MSISLLAASVDMSGTFKVAVSFASTFQCTSRKYFLKDHVEPFAVEWRQPFSENNFMLTPRTTRGNWRKTRKRSPARNRSGFMRTIVASTITAAIVPLIAEGDGDVTERGDLRLGTLNQLTPVSKARRMNVRSQFCV